MFVDENSDIDREALRLYILNELNRIKKLTQLYLTDDRYHSFWEAIHNYINQISEETKKQNLVQVESQLHNLPDFIDKWIHTAVDTDQRFEFFILAKAEDIKSGDQPHDYFWALQIRHDQLVGLIRVLNKLMEHIKRWTTLPADQVISDGVFLGMTVYSIETQIYLEAENIHKNRDKLL